MSFIFLSWLTKFNVLDFIYFFGIYDELGVKWIQFLCFFKIL